MSQLAATPLPEEDRLRADLFNYMGLILAGPPDQTLLDQCAALSGDDSELGQGFVALSKLASKTKPAGAESEFNKLFVGLGRGELLPYASWYLAGFLMDKPLVTLRRDLERLGIERSPGITVAVRSAQRCSSSTWSSSSAGSTLGS